MEGGTGVALTAADGGGLMSTRTSLAKCGGGISFPRQPVVKREFRPKRREVVGIADR